MSCLFSCCASLACGCCTSVASGISKKSARIAYCGLFGASLVLSWVLREVGYPLLKSFSWINNVEHTKEWYQTSTVLRVSLGNFLFFTVLALIMIGVKDQNDKRDSWHHGGWLVKFIIWLLLIVLMFFMPNVIIDIYGVLSKFGAGLFLLVQVVLLLDFTYVWNDAWVEKDEQKWYIALLAVSVGCYIAAFAFSGILFIWFNPSGQDCGLNVFFISMTMILAFAFAVIALHPTVNGSLLPASVISVYCAYVCYTALSSEPRDYVCNGLHNKSKAVTVGTLVLGMITTVLSVLYSALRAGSSKAFLSPPSSPRAATKVSKSTAFKPNHGISTILVVGISGATNPLLGSEDTEAGKNKGISEPRPVSYSYMFFHLIFALASMYSAMLLSGWTSSNDNSDLIDVGWASVWVKICTEWVTAGIYIWSLVAPLLMPDREFL